MNFYAMYDCKEIIVLYPDQCL